MIKKINWVSVSTFKRDNHYIPKKEIRKSGSLTFDSIVKSLKKPAIGTEKGSANAFGLWKPKDVNAGKVKANVSSVSGVMLDIDGGEFSFEYLQKKMDGFGYNYILHSTYSNKNTKKDEKGVRARIIIPLQEDIAPEDYRNACYNVLYDSGILSTSDDKQTIKSKGIDTSVFSPERIVYKTVTEKEENYLFHFCETKTFYKYEKREETQPNTHLGQKTYKDIPVVQDFLKQISDILSAKSYQQGGKNQTPFYNKKDNRYYIVEKFNYSNLNLDFLVNEFPEYYEKQGDRIHRVGSESSAGISLKEDGFVSSHDNDPMQSKFYKPFDVIKKLRCNNDFKQTLTYLYENKDRYHLMDSDFPEWVKPVEVNYIYKSEDNKSVAYTYGSITFYSGWLQQKENPFEYIFGNVLFPKGYVSIISAPAGTGKSTLAASLIVSYIKKESFISYPSNYKEGNVVLILTEGAVEQYEYIFKDMKLSDEQRRKITIVDYHGKQNKNELQEGLKMIQNIELIVLDAYLGLEKKANNNDVESAKEGLGFFESLAKEYKCGMLVLGHSNKNQNTKGMNPDNIMGTSYFVAIARQACQLTKEGNDAIGFQVTKQNCFFTMGKEEIKQAMKKHYLKFGENFTYIEEDQPSSVFCRIEDLFKLLKNIPEQELVSLTEDFKQEDNSKKHHTIRYFLSFLAKQKEIDISDVSDDTLLKSIKRLETNYEDITQKIKQNLSA